MASAWVVGAALGAPFGGPRGRRLLGALLAALALTWIAAAFTPLTASLASGLVRRDALRRSDAVFVLASRLQLDGGATATAQCRLLHGLELLHQGWAPRLILSEVAASPGSHVAFARRSMERIGATGEVLAVGPVERTRDEALALAELYARRDWGRVIAVTSPSHSRRASAALETAGLSVISSPCDETRYDIDSLDRPRERLLAFADVLYERGAGWLYARRGWIKSP